MTECDRCGDDLTTEWEYRGETFCRECNEAVRAKHEGRQAKLGDVGAGGQTSIDGFDE